MQCAYFDEGRCRSCSLMGTHYPDQLAEKQSLCADVVTTRWLEPVASRESGFRSKAKLAVGGTVEEPTLGILDREYRGVDLTDCGIHTEGLRRAIPRLARFVTETGLVPYDVAARRGELKHIIVTESPDEELLVRFVLRSTRQQEAIGDSLSGLQADLPIRVASVNILPTHVALLEGDEETILTADDTLPMRLAGLTLHLGVRSFFQTNLEIAAALYGQAAVWTDEITPDSVWDLYCGVGGFALAVAPAAGSVLGVESSADAVVSARRSAEESGQRNAHFSSGDATASAVAAGEAPDLVIVNPPRRGLDTELCRWLDESDTGHIIYSSCNPETLARDIERMPSFMVTAGRVFDMFPQTRHGEVMVRLDRR